VNERIGLRVDPATILLLKFFRSFLQGFLKLKDLGIFILETVHDGYSLLFVDRSLDHA
jgi:hypothetical protein